MAGGIGDQDERQSGRQMLAPPDDQILAMPKVPRDEGKPDAVSEAPDEARFALVAAESLSERHAVISRGFVLPIVHVTSGAGEYANLLIEPDAHKITDIVKDRRGREEQAVETVEQSA